MCAERAKRRNKRTPVQAASRSSISNHCFLSALPAECAICEPAPEDDVGSGTPNAIGRTDDRTAIRANKNGVRRGLTAKDVVGSLEGAEDCKAFEASIISAPNPP